MLPFSIPTAVVTDHEMGAPEQTQGRPPVSIDPSDVLLCDLGNKAMLAEDLENALRLWNKPAVLIAGRNSLDRLPVNLPGTILFLDLSWNRLTLLGGFESLPNLRELDLSHNSAEKMLGLASNTSLRVLRISHNRIRRIEGLHHLRVLEEADFSHNLLKTKADVRALSLNTALRRLRIEGNPFCSTGVQRGSYQVAMQHLLPGMSLLDGNPPSVLSPSLSQQLPPPPQPVAGGQHHYRVGHRGYHGSHHRGGMGFPQRSFTRDGRAVYSLTGDLSVARGWRDSAVIRSSSEKHRSLSEPPSTDRGGLGVARATTGGGGPPVDPGSYVEMFFNSKRKEQHSAMVSDTVADPQPTTTKASWEKRGLASSDCQGLGQEWGETTKTGRPTLLQTDVHNKRVVPGGSEGAFYDAGGVGSMGGHHHKGGYDASRSILHLSLSYHGMSRAERGAARRLAWSEARQEGAVDVGRAGRRRRTTSTTRKITPPGDNGRRQTVGVVPPEISRPPGKRGEAASFSTTVRGHSSVGRIAHGGAAVDASRGTSSQILAAAGRHSRRTPAATAGETASDLNGGNGGKYNNAVGSRSDTPSRLRDGCRQAGDMRGRARSDGDERPGAKRPINLRRAAGGVHEAAGGRWDESRHSGVANRSAVRGRGVGRQSSGGSGVLATSGSGGGAGRPRGVKEKHSVSAARSNGSGGETYRFKTTLGHRSRRGQRPIAPLTSPWAPREDAKPWRDKRGSHDGSGGDEQYVTIITRRDEESTSHSGAPYLALEKAAMMAPSTKRRVENRPRKGDTSFHQSKGGLDHDRYDCYRDHLHSRDNHHHGGESASFDADAHDNVGGDCYDDGTGDQDGLIDRDTRQSQPAAPRPFVSLLSPAGILQRTSSARFSAGGSSIATTGECPRVSHMHWTGNHNEWNKVRHDHAGVVEGEKGRQPGSTVAPKHWQEGPVASWADTPDRYMIEPDNNLPGDSWEEYQEGYFRNTGWVDEQPPSRTTSIIVPHFPTEGNSADVVGRLQYQKAYASRPSQFAYYPPAIGSQKVGDEPESVVGDGSGSSGGKRRDRDIRGGVGRSRRQRHHQESAQQHWPVIPPLAGILTSSSASKGKRTKSNDPLRHRQDTVDVTMGNGDGLETKNSLLTRRSNVVVEGNIREAILDRRMVQEMKISDPPHGVVTDGGTLIADSEPPSACVEPTGGGTVRVTDRGMVEDYRVMAADKMGSS